MRDGEPCSHRGCLSHVTHPCEVCGRIAGRSNNNTLEITIENALKDFDYGFTVTYDGDRNVVLFGASCNRCGMIFEDKKLSVYCGRCVQ